MLASVSGRIKVEIPELGIQCLKHQENNNKSPGEKGVTYNISLFFLQHTILNLNDLDKNKF